MIRKSILIALGVIVMFGASMLAPTTASAYKSEAECESFEGKGKCSHCILGVGDGGWHRSAACAVIAVQNPNSAEAAKMAEEVKADEAAKVTKQLEQSKRPLGDPKKMAPR